MTADISHNCCSGLACGASLSFIHCSTRRKISLPPRFVRLEINSWYQGIYPTAIFVVVTTRMSTADMLSHLGPQTHHRPSTMIFTPHPPTAQPSIPAITVGSSSDSNSFVESCEDRSTGTLASSNPEKGGGLSGGHWQDMQD